MARHVNVDVFSEMIEISDPMWDTAGTLPIFVHQNLLQERSPYFKALIDNGEVGEHGRVTIDLDTVSYEACTMFARWLYGQPLCTESEDPDDDLLRLLELYNVACDAEKQSGTMDNELANACLDGIQRSLNQKSKTLRDPILALEDMLVEDDKYPGKAIVLNQLVYGECATDGRIKAWLETYCKSKYHETEVVQVICLE